MEYALLLEKARSGAITREELYLVDPATFDALCEDLIRLQRSTPAGIAWKELQAGIKTVSAAVDDRTCQENMVCTPAVSA